MALTPASVNPQKVTLASGTGDQEINLDLIMPKDMSACTFVMDNISGPIRFNTLGAAADASLSAVYTTTDKPIFVLAKGTTLHIRGAAGSETFQLTALT